MKFSRQGIIFVLSAMTKTEKKAVSLKIINYFRERNEILENKTINRLMNFQKGVAT